MLNRVGFIYPDRRHTSSTTIFWSPVSISGVVT
jgi:hypothetical protein